MCGISYAIFRAETDIRTIILAASPYLNVFLREALSAFQVDRKHVVDVRAGVAVFYQVCPLNLTLLTRPFILKKSDLLHILKDKSKEKKCIISTL